MLLAARKIYLLASLIAPLDLLSALLALRILTLALLAYLLALVLILCFFKVFRYFRLCLRLELIHFFAKAFILLNLADHLRAALALLAAWSDLRFALSFLMSSRFFLATLRILPFAFFNDFHARSTDCFTLLALLRALCADLVMCLTVFIICLSLLAIFLALRSFLLAFLLAFPALRFATHASLLPLDLPEHLRRGERRWWR